jgi:hypothetical protein
MLCFEFARLQLEAHLEVYTTEFAANVVADENSAV